MSSNKKETQRVEEAQPSGYDSEDEQDQLDSPSKKVNDKRKDLNDNRTSPLPSSTKSRFKSSTTSSNAVPEGRAPRDFEKPPSALKAADPMAMSTNQLFSNHSSQQDDQHENYSPNESRTHSQALSNDVTGDENQPPCVSYPNQTSFSPTQKETTSSAPPPAQRSLQNQKELSTSSSAPVGLGGGGNSSSVSVSRVSVDGSTHTIGATQTQGGSEARGKHLSWDDPRDRLEEGEKLFAVEGSSVGQDSQTCECWKEEAQFKRHTFDV